LAKIKDLAELTNLDLGRIINHHSKEAHSEDKLNLEMVFKIHQGEFLVDSKITNLQASKTLIKWMDIKWIAVIQKYHTNLETLFQIFV
jgi:hypothetical protein